MISKLPSWVWIGGATLAFIAGYVNAIGLLGFEHQAVSHMTGMTSQLGLALVENDYSAALDLGVIITSFFCGAIVSGLVVRDNTLKLGRHYGVALAIESILLGLSARLLNAGDLAGVALVAAACGLQNGMASTYSGTIIRTTHVTGLITDAGIVLGQLVAGLRPDFRRFMLAASLILGYLTGGMVGGYLYFIIKYKAIYFAAGATGCMAIGYAIVSHFRILRPSESSG